MAALCQAPPDGVGFLSGALNFIDCQAQTIGEAGYRALAQPGSSTSLALTALLTIFVALFGIRLLLGRALDFGEMMIAVIKVGIVLMLASSWSAYRITTYDLVLKSPAELASAVGSPANLPGAAGGLTARFQGVDNALLILIDSGTGRLDPATSRQLSSPDAPPLTRAPISDDIALGLGRVIYLTTVIGALGLVRLAAGLLLALAPLFAGFLLFDVTRSLFGGWARTLAALIIAAFAVTLILSVELAALEPMLTQILSQRAALILTPAAPVELLVISLAFAAISVGVIMMSFRLAFAPSLALWINQPAAWARQIWRGEARAQGADRSPEREAGDTSRALMIAGAVSAAQRREQLAQLSSGVSQSGLTAPRSPDKIRESGGGVAAVPIGQSYVRTTRRISPAATQRNRRQ